MYKKLINKLLLLTIAHYNINATENENKTNIQCPKTSIFTKIGISQHKEIVALSGIFIVGGGVYYVVSKKKEKKKHEEVTEFNFMYNSTGSQPLSYDCKKLREHKISINYQKKQVEIFIDSDDKGIAVINDNAIIMKEKSSNKELCKLTVRDISNNSQMLLKWCQYIAGYIHLVITNRKKEETKYQITTHDNTISLQEQK